MCKCMKEDFRTDVKCKRFVAETETIPAAKSKLLTDDVIVHAYVVHLREL